MKAKFIKTTNNRGAKDRWECPRCRKDPNQPECRFNLSQKRRSNIHHCRFCNTPLLLEKLKKIQKEVK